MADLVIVGVGTAGCVLAARLSEDASRSVCLVEAGPDYGPYADGRWPADIVDGRWLALDSHCWNRDDEEDRSQLRARIVGGCSAHNACVVLRGADADYDEWGPGWTAAEFAPYLGRAERAFSTRRLEEVELSPWHRAFAAALDEAIVHEVNLTPDGVRWSAAFRRAAHRLGFAPRIAYSGHGWRHAASAQRVMRGRCLRPVRVPGRRSRLRDQRGDLRHEAALARPGRSDLRRSGRATADRARIPVRRARRGRARGRLRASARARAPAGDPALRRTRNASRTGVSAREHVRATARGFFHPTGTCAIGRVVDERCRVLGYEQLVVSDASVMPTIPRANTNLTTAAIAERVAELI